MFWQLYPGGRTYILDFIQCFKEDNDPWILLVALAESSQLGTNGIKMTNENYYTQILDDTSEL